MIMLLCLFTLIVYNELDLNLYFRFVEHKFLYRALGLLNDLGTFLLAKFAYNHICIASAIDFAGKLKDLRIMQH